MTSNVGAEPALLSQRLTTASTDQIVASFEREFDRQLVPATPVTRAAIDGDVLYKLVNKVLQSEDGTDVRHLNLIAGAE